MATASCDEYGGYLWRPCYGLWQKIAAGPQDDCVLHVRKAVNASKDQDGLATADGCVCPAHVQPRHPDSITT